MGQPNPGHGRKGAAKVKRLGRNKAKILKYYSKVWAPRKIRHMLRHNGYPFAQSWAEKNGCGYLLP